MTGRLWVLMSPASHDHQPQDRADRCSWASASYLMLLPRAQGEDGGGGQGRLQGGQLPGAWGGAQKGQEEV